MNGTKFRELRLSLHLSQAELAHRLGITAQTVARAEGSSVVKSKYERRLLEFATASVVVQPTVAPDDALASYNALVAAATALYRLAKSATKADKPKAQGYQRMSEEEKAERQMARPDIQARARVIYLLKDLQKALAPCRGDPARSEAAYKLWTGMYKVSGKSELLEIPSSIEAYWRNCQAAGYDAHDPTAEEINA